MARSIDIRRAWVFGLALALFLAVIGPACLMSASEAMGMPMTDHSSVPKDCTGPAGSMSACPHADPVEVTAAPAAPDAAVIDAVFVEVDVSPVDVFAGRIPSRAERPTSSPPTHFTPLRL